MDSANKMDAFNLFGSNKVSKSEHEGLRDEVYRAIEMVSNKVLELERSMTAEISRLSRGIEGVERNMQQTNDTIARVKSEMATLTASNNSTAEILEAFERRFTDQKEYMEATRRALQIKSSDVDRLNDTLTHMREELAKHSRFIDQLRTAASEDQNPQLVSSIY